MGNRIVFAMGLLAAFLFTSSISFAQAPDKTKKFDPHDLSGVWVAVGGGPSALLDDKKRPPMTPDAQAKFDTAVPSLGPRVIAGKENDPTLHCDPDGFPKLLTSPEPFEIVMASRRMFEFFEKDHIWREIWTDGRKLPADPDPTWNGTSVGHWEGDTLVVDSDGFDDRTWLDYYGDPHSQDMHLTEKYRRLDPDTMSISVVVTDPEMYKAPWTGESGIYKLHPDWEIQEWYCTQSDQKNYDNSIRIPAGGSGAETPAPEKK